MAQAKLDENRNPTLIGVDEIGFTTPVNVAVNSTSHELLVSDNTSQTLLGGIAGLVPSVYDYVSLSYTGADLTGAVFKLGGSSGTVVSTLTLAYTGGDIVSITKT